MFTGVLPECTLPCPNFPSMHTNPFGLGPILTASPNRHSLGYWGLRLQHMNLRNTTRHITGPLGLMPFPAHELVKRGLLVTRWH